MVVSRGCRYNTPHEVYQPPIQPPRALIEPPSAASGHATSCPSRVSLALIPDALRGRVTGAFRLLTFTCDALGIALTGLLLQQIGVLGTILCFEAALVMLAVAATLNRSMRAARKLADL